MHQTLELYREEPLEQTNSLKSIKHSTATYGSDREEHVFEYLSFKSNLI